MSKLEQESDPFVSLLNSPYDMAQPRSRFCFILVSWEQQRVREARYLVQGSSGAGDRFQSVILNYQVSFLPSLRCCQH